MTISDNNSVKRILVIEDNQGIAEMYAAYFEMSGYHCLVKSAGTAISQLIASYRPDLILLDYLLPEQNGGELCNLVKADPFSSHIPVIMCSAFPKSKIDSQAVKYDAFIAKPFDLDELSFLIERLTAT
jgi:DNA-binding response OmpR family regulator